MTQQNDVLGKENDHLRANLNDAFEEIERLKARLLDYQTRDHTVKIDENETKIIALIAKYDKGIKAAEISRQISMNIRDTVWIRSGPRLASLRCRTSFRSREQCELATANAHERIS
jgi:hypothetical protein